MYRTTFEIIDGKILGYDSTRRLYKISTGDGGTINGCRYVGGAINNNGARMVAELTPGLYVLVVLRYTASVATGNASAPDAFILGGIESYTETGKLGDSKEKPVLESGDQGLIDKYGRRILMRSNGVIEIVAAPLAQIVLDPIKKKITTRAKSYNSQRDNASFMRWTPHPDSVDDFKNSLFHMGITGDGSPEKLFPDIEILAGSLQDLDPDVYMADTAFPVDPGSRLAARVSHPDAEKRTDVLIQAGSLAEGEIVRADFKRDGGVEGVFRLGDMKDDEDSDMTGEFVINNVRVRTYADGRFRVYNDGSEIEATNEGRVNIFCAESYLGSKSESPESAGAGEKHLAIAEVVKDFMEQLIDAIENAQWQTTGPGAPTAPKGLLSMPAFEAIKARLDDLISDKHSFDGAK